MHVPVFPATVSAEGRLQFERYEREALDAWLGSLVGKPVLVTVKDDVSSLTERQRRWYFGQVLRRIHNHNGQPLDDLHLYYKDKFLGSPENKLLVIVDANGAVVDERAVLHRPSITVLGRKAMASYCDAIREDAAVMFGLDIPNPDPQWRTAA